MSGAPVYCLTMSGIASRVEAVAGAGGTGVGVAVGVGLGVIVGVAVRVAVGVGVIVGVEVGGLAVAVGAVTVPAGHSLNVCTPRMTHA